MVYRIRETGIAVALLLAYRALVDYLYRRLPGESRVLAPPAIIYLSLAGLF